MSENESYKDLQKYLGPVIYLGIKKFLTNFKATYQNVEKAHVTNFLEENKNNSIMSLL